MKAKRRDFIKQSASLAAVISMGSLSCSRSGAISKGAVHKEARLNGLAKDAGMKMSNAYFWGMEAHSHLIELAKQIGAYGAIAGIDRRLFKNPDAKPWEYESIKNVVDAWKGVGLAPR